MKLTYHIRMRIAQIKLVVALFAIGAIWIHYGWVPALIAFCLGEGYGETPILAFFEPEKDES